MEKFDKYETVRVSGRTHVLIRCDSRGGKMPDADYLGTGLALCAVLKKGQTFENWLNLKRRI